MLATVQDLVERENLAAWSALEYHNPFPCTDYSSSASITLKFDDSSVDGRTRTSVSINVEAACQHCGGDVIQEFRNLLETAVLDAELLLQKVTEAPVYGLGMMLYHPQPAEIPDSKHPDVAWECPNCGNASNTGTFCTECGTKNKP